MHPKLSQLLVDGAFVQGSDGIFSAANPSFALDQESERVLRERVAAQRYDDYLSFIAQHHSIPVMDHEVGRFLATMPQGALILDIGGCWGWHWRRLAAIRPDVGVVIIDFVRANLGHARTLLGPLVGAQIALLHADATNLPFPVGTMCSGGFDGVWTVGVFCLIPDFPRACREAHRVLRSGGRLALYSLHATPFNRMVYWLFRKRYHRDGMLENAFHLSRATDAQRQIVADIFGKEVEDRYTECLFQPELRLTVTGREGNLLGRLDALLGDFPFLGRWIAHQRSFEVLKS